MSLDSPSSSRHTEQNSTRALVTRISVVFAPSQSPARKGTSNKRRSENRHQWSHLPNEGSPRTITPSQELPHTQVFMKTSDLMATLDDIADAVVRLDGQGKCVTMNQAAVQIFRRLGGDPGRTIGKSVWELFPDLKGTVAEQQLRRALDDQRPIQDELYSPADQRWYDTQGFPSSPGVVLIFRDITEWKTGHSSEPNHTRYAL